MFTIDGCTVDIRLDTARGVEIGLPGPTILVTNFSNRTKFFKFAFFSAVHEDGSFNRFLLINDSGYRVWPKSDGTLEIIGEQETAIKTGSKAYFLGDSQGRGWLRVEAGRTAEKRFPRERSTSADVPIRIWYIQSSTSDLLLKDYAFGAVEALHALNGSNGSNAPSFTRSLQLAEKGDTKAQLRVGDAYLFGNGVSKNSQNGIMWLRRAAEQGDPEAQSSLGNAYLSGSAGSQDLQAAAEWFRKAAMQGDAMAANGLGVVLKRGNGLDKQEAVKWFRIAAEKGDMTAQLNLGDCYYFAAGVEGNAEQAAFWFRKAAEQGDPDAQVFLAAMCADGTGMPVDLPQAWQWSELAAARGETKGAKALEFLQHRMTKDQIAAAKDLERAFLENFLARRPSQTKPSHSQ